MQLREQTILITGGGSGIGLELCKTLVQKGNTVITCGRSEEKLEAAKKSVPGLVTYTCDLSNQQACMHLANTIITNHPDLNILINNAAIVNRIDYLNDTTSLELADMEFQTNIMAPIRLIRMLYQTICTNKQFAIINITTGLVYAPRASYPFYNATKAALHSFTQTLRLQLAKENTKVVEVLFPVVDTPWHRCTVPKMAISAQEAVAGMLLQLEKGKTEIRVGKVKLLYLLSRIAPAFSIRMINQGS